MTWCRAARANQREAGFTLLELLLALGILALALAIAVPSLSRSHQNLATRSAAYELASYLRSARIAAQSSNSERVMTLDLMRGQYWAAGLGSPRSLPLGTKIVVPDSERVGNGASRIRFFPDGGTSGANITLQDEQGAVTIAVDWLNGDVRVHSRR